MKRSELINLFYYISELYEDELVPLALAINIAGGINDIKLPKIYKNITNLHLRDYEDILLCIKEDEIIRERAINCVSQAIRFDEIPEKWEYLKKIYKSNYTGLFE